MNVLVLTSPFGGRDAGDRVTDPAEIARILAGEHAHHVVRAHHGDVDAPADITDVGAEGSDDAARKEA